MLVLSSPVLTRLETVSYHNLKSDQALSIQLEDHPDLLWQAVNRAQALVAQVK